MVKDYEKMTIKELEKAKQDTGDQIRVLRIELRQAQLEWNIRQKAIKVQAIVDGLSDEDRKRLVQVLSPKGINTRGMIGDLLTD